MKIGVNLENVATYYQLAEVFNLTNVARETSRLISSCFQAVSGSKNFLQLDFSSVIKILSSSELQVDSELEVMAAAHAWLTHNYDERIKFTEKLFTKIRISLLPDEVLKKIFSKPHFTRSAYVFQQNEECVRAVRKALMNKTNRKTRYCSQSEFSVLICGGMNTRSNTLDCDVTRVDGENFDDVRRLTKFPKCDYIMGVIVQSQFYLFSYNHSGSWMSARKYDFTLNTWQMVGSIKNSLDWFRLCAFMSRVYFIGGCRGSSSRPTKRCFYFDAASASTTATLGTKNIAKMNEAREFPASCAFQGKVVASGGLSFHRRSRTNEAYCHVSDEWTRMPDMVHGRSEHRLIAMRSRLYAVGGLASGSAEACEVYDALSGRFSVLRSPIWGVGRGMVCGAFSAGEKILVFKDESSKVAVFDTERGAWTEEEFGVTKDLKRYLCLKIPKIC